MNIEPMLLRVQTTKSDETPSPAGMQLASFNLQHIPTGGLTVVSPAVTLVAEAIYHMKSLPTIEVDAKDDALVDGLLIAASTNTWRPIKHK